MKVPHIYFFAAGPDVPLTIGSFLLLDQFFARKQRLQEGLNLKPYHVQSAGRGDGNMG